MTDKQFIETLRNIKNYCAETVCEYCKFKNPNPKLACPIVIISKSLLGAPASWDIESIERVLKEYD